MIYSDNDTIAAIATAMSDAGIGIIRVSGPQAVQIVDNCYLNVGKKHDLLFHAPNTIQYGYICNQKEEILDEVMAQQRKQELELYKLYAQDPSFYQSFLNTMKQVINVR